ncbi:MAG TPA: N-formylglutamate amidohydrolase [Polyangiaceae bacterium]
MQVILAADEPPPFEIVARRRSSSPYVIQCDHASNRIPRALDELGLPPPELERHIAWDIGAEAVARHLAEALDAWLILQNYSRLVIDCNRALEHPDSIVRSSEDTPIPGNRDVLPIDAERRAKSIFEPYHARIARELDERAAVPTIMIFLHSFTPTFRGVSRPWDAGVLFHRDRRFAAPLFEALRSESGLVVGENEPYAASALTDYGLVEHAERRGLLHVELEIRQDLIERAADQLAWAERLARIVRIAEASAAR